MAETAALVVAMEARLDKFEKALKDAQKMADKSTKEIENSFDRMNKAIGDKLDSMTRRFASYAGPLGDILSSSLGKGGLLAAAGIGALVLAIDFVSGKVDAFVDKARKLKEAAETAGLTIEQFAALSKAGRQVGLDSEQSALLIDKLAASVGLLQARGEGPLFDALLRIDKGLLEQVARAKDTATAIDLITAAYAKLDSQIAKLAFQREAGLGRDPAIGRLLDEIGKKGSVDAVTAAAKASGGGIDKEQLDKAIELKKQIEEIQRHTDRMWGEAFSIPVLEAQKASAQYLERIAAASLAAAQAGPAKLQYPSGTQFARKFRGEPTVTEPGTPPSPLTKDAMQVYADNLLKWKQQQENATTPQTGLIGPTQDTIGPQKPTEENIPVKLNELKQLIGVLGDAVKPAEELRKKELELQIATKDHVVTAAEAARAMKAFTDAQTKATIAVHETLGVATEEEMVKRRLIDINTAVVKGQLTVTQAVQAETIARKEAKEALEAQIVRTSALPNMQRLALDNANTLKQIDQFGAATFSNFENAFVSVITQSKNVKDAIHDMAIAILADFAKLALRQATAPLFSSLVGALGGALTTRAEGGPVSAGEPYLVGERRPEIFVPSTSGTIIPNTSGMGGGSFTIAMNNDFRGVDPASVNRVEAKLNELQRTLPAQVASIVPDLRRRSVRGF